MKSYFLEKIKNVKRKELQLNNSLYHILKVMKQLSNKVSIVPVIAKSDCLTPKEISDLKKIILKEIRDNGIKVYTLPDCDRCV